MTRSLTFSAKKRRRPRKHEYTKPFNSNIIAWVLLAALALFVLVVRAFW
ncbi:hypothetical protein [Hymenobacter sp. BT559]|nr:hypothetical protein [Hymenobacter sp. BT559]MBJ6142247.1 hypothetical protein [Hymenobacter sp. BT559]